MTEHNFMFPICETASPIRNMVLKQFSFYLDFDSDVNKNTSLQLCQHTCVLSWMLMESNMFLLETHQNDGLVSYLQFQNMMLTPLMSVLHMRGGAVKLAPMLMHYLVWLSE